MRYKSSSEDDGSRPILTRPRLTSRLRGKLCPRLDRMIAPFSHTTTAPVLDQRQFGWSAVLRANWEAIRDEAYALTRDPDSAPTLNTASPGQRTIAADQGSRSFILIGYGARIEQNLARCSGTAAVLQHVPRLSSAFFSILKPGARIPLHMGVTKGLITCHLGLIIPDGPLHITVNEHDLTWREGETMFFDDRYPHQIRNETAQTRVIFLVQFERPFCQPGRAFAKALLRGIIRSAFGRDTVTNIAK